ncbi:MAG: acyl-CoA synthetase [Acidimicrobiia bacterium]
MYPGNFAETSPDRPAVIMATSGETQTYRELNERSNQVAQYLRSVGLERGDHVALFMENQIHFMEIVWGALRSGIYITAINSHLTSEEVAYIVEDCEAKVFFTSRALAEVASGIDWGSLSRVTNRLMCDGNAEGFDSYEDLMAAQPTSGIADESHGTIMLYSSGTTGRPKGVIRPLPEGHPADEDDPLLSAMGMLYQFADGMAYLSPAPMYHAAPLAFSINVHRFGGVVVIMERFDPEQALQLIEKYKITHSQWVPTMFIRLLRLSEEQRNKYDLSSHKVAIHAAAPCPVPVKRDMIEWWGPVIYEYYAGTEGNGSTFITSEDWLEHPGSVGRPMVGEIHILDEDGNELGPREEGAIYFGGGGEFEYHNDPAKTAESRRSGGLSTLGDVGYLDEEGYLYLTDRKAHMIISGGVNIYPREIEDVLIQHPAVADVAVFGVPNEDFGEEVKAVIQLLDGEAAEDETKTELMNFMRQHLASYKVPRSIDFRDELPRLPTGKLYKRILVDEYKKAYEAAQG